MHDIPHGRNGWIATMNSNPMDGSSLGIFKPGTQNPEPLNLDKNKWEEI
jgi:hypothetical protein